jgi:hypothetical protein
LAVLTVECFKNAHCVFALNESYSNIKMCIRTLTRACINLISATELEISRRLPKIRRFRICRAAHVVAEKFRDLFTNYAHGVRARHFVAENCQKQQKLFK